MMQVCGHELRVGEGRPCIGTSVMEIMPGTCSVDLSRPTQGHTIVSGPCPNLRSKIRDQCEPSMLSRILEGPSL